MGKTNWTTCWRFLLSTIIKVVFVPSHHIWGAALTPGTNGALEYEARTQARIPDLKDMWTTQGLLVLTVLLLHVHKRTLSNIHEKAGKYNFWNKTDLHMERTSTEDMLRGGWEDRGGGGGLGCWGRTIILVIDTRFCQSVSLALNTPKESFSTSWHDFNICLKVQCVEFSDIYW